MIRIKKKIELSEELYDLSLNYKIQIFQNVINNLTEIVNNNNRNLFGSIVIVYNFDPSMFNGC